MSKRAEINMDSFGILL